MPLLSWRERHPAAHPQGDTTMAKGTTYTVKKVKMQGEKKYYQEVGKVLIRESGENGVLFLHFLDGEFALFAQEEKAKAAKEGQEAPAAA
jgi:hypothetical protein